MLPPGNERDESLEADWTPTPEFVATTNLAWLMERTRTATYEELHAWSVRHRAEYWGLAIERLGVRFERPCRAVLDLSRGVEAPQWLPGARLNVVESCFSAPSNSPAIIYQAEGGELSVMKYGELRALTGRVAANLRRLGYQPGDALAILMPMTAVAVAIYLGIVAAGCAVVGIADSFRPREIATRLRIAKAAGVFTQDVLLRGGKELPLYANAIETGAPRTIVVPARESLALPLRAGDVAWQGFLEIDAPLEITARDPEDTMNVLFSSGTTGEPKAIPWTQTTPLKCAADAHFHQDIRPGEVLVWPTNIGWMMGPWVIFGSLMNRAAMGLYYGAPTGREFGEFVVAAKARVLGVVPSLVRTWRNTGCMEGLDWSGIKCFTSTGECSRADDMRWLMQTAGGRPVIEYCGGTEIGGAYISSVLARPNIAGTFNTPTLGLDVMILDEEGQPAEIGELFVVPPSIGLSNSLLNKDHEETYFAGAPRGPGGETLRRHGDQMERLPGGYWRAHGRADDTMNLGGIKVSSAEIEQTLRAVPGVTETAAIAVSSGGGPSLLVIYAVCSGAPEKTLLATAMQGAIKRDLNPLFKIHDVVVIDALPRTASNKVMRRELRARYNTSPAS
ncbi:MAG: AMP-binding protein [Chthoniobacter sp.]|uniref:AMP-binding protein n=1 Tax=Chthoniobacter sp. TaxID=2510640 RepID=UPI0032A365A0